LRFPYFVRKTAPVSGVASLLDIDAGIDIWAEPGGTVEMALAVTVPVTSLCPCSKEISERTAPTTSARTCEPARAVARRQ
jgi:GTP cyclohydrolase I